MANKVSIYINIFYMVLKSSFWIFNLHLRGLAQIKFKQFFAENLNLKGCFKNRRQLRSSGREICKLMLSQCSIDSTTEKRTEAQRTSEEARLPLQTTMKPAKSGHLCQKHATEYDPDTLKKLPPVKPNPSICSCPKCDSLECFAIRNSSHCVCNNENTCLAPTSVNGYTNKVNCTSRCSINAITLPVAVKNVKEPVPDEITNEFSTNHKVHVVKKVSTYSNKSLSLHSRDNTDDNKTKALIENLSIRSGTIRYSRQNFETNTAKLSAQIMNVPYSDFKESISYYKTENDLPKPKFLSSYDILTRIKEAYKACSCKVCECLIGKSKDPSEYCTCKPCECDDCRTLLSKLNGLSSENVRQYHIGCPCIRCDRKKDCKGIVKNGPPAYCDCDPCECLKCSDKSPQPCNCQPCECIECKSYLANRNIPRKNNTFLVATMREDSPRAACQCAPCECGECGQTFTLGSSFRREMGTGINRPVSCTCDTCVNQACESYDGNSCTCDVQKQLMRKPVEKDVRDYDIHRASVNKNVIERKSKHQNNTIAMFAAVGNRFPQFDIKKNNSCSCGDCECIICSCKDKIKNTSANYNPSKYSNSCKCSPCECLLCNNKNNDYLGRKNICECDICDCLKCDGLSQPSTSYDERQTNSIQYKSTTPSNACKCSPCECHNCQKMMYKCTGDSCVCTNCKCEMCSDQTKFINETVYENRNNYLPFTCGSPIKNKLFTNKNYAKTSLPQYGNKESPILIKSNQNLLISDDPSKVNGLIDNPVRKSTQVLISNNTKEQKKYQTVNYIDYAECDKNKLVQSYRRSPEYESSRSFVSENSSFGLTCRSSNIKLYCNLDSVKEQYNTRTTKSPDNSIIVKFPVNKCMDDEDTYPTYSVNIENENNNSIYDVNSDVKDLEITNKASKTKTEFSVDDERSHSNTQINKAYSSISKNYNFTNQDREITNVRDLSLKLVASLRDANERLSVLIKPRGSFYHAKLGPSKADISLPRKDTDDAYSDFNSPLKKSYFQNTEDFCDIEIDYDKVQNTLQQAKAFSTELTKILRDYKKANRKLECKSLRENRNDGPRTSLVDWLNRNNNTDTNKIINTIVEREPLVKGIDQEPSSLAYEPVKKYASHNLNVMKSKEGLFETQSQQSAKIGLCIKSIPDDESNHVTHDVEDRTTLREQQVEENVTTVNVENILIDQPSSSINTPRKVEVLLNRHSESSANSINQRTEGRRSRSDKTQKNIKSNKFRVPRAVVLYKRLKLKEALMNLASKTNIGVRQNNLVPQSIQCGESRAVIVDETTQGEPHVDVEKPHTTTTSTDAGSRNGNSSFMQPLEASHGLDNWSILKKNCFVNSPFTQNRRLSLMPPLFLDLKDTLRAITSQDGEPSGAETVPGHGNRALLKLQTEVKKLWVSSMTSSNSGSKPESPAEKSELDLKSKDFNIASSQTCQMISSAEKSVDCMDSTFSVAILQRQVRELLKMKALNHPVVKRSLKATNVGNSGGTSIKSELTISKSSCDTLKVKFLCLRRVSDHTVVVKWKAPPDVSKVNGYELLVDGRAVQKMLNPSRCMAVVSCLPHAEKVLVTVRTLLCDAARAHRPATTVVYRTRPKPA